MLRMSRMMELRTQAPDFSLIDTGGLASVIAGLHLRRIYGAAAATTG